MMTMVIAIVAVALGGQTREKAATLPDTPQGQMVAAYVKAFNAGEKEFMAAHEKLFAPEVLEKMPAERRAEMYKRMSGDFGKLTVERVVSATPERIAFTTTLKDGAVATLSFSFEAKAPYRITGLNLDVRGGRPDVATRPRAR
jgi:hypothetical protein